MGNVLTFINDKLSNLVSRMGTDRDKASASRYGIPLYNYQELDNAFRGAWLPKKIVEIPALDSCRRWRNWQCEKEQIEAIEKEERRLALQSRVLEARVRARLTGGAAIYISTGERIVNSELRLDRITKGGIKFLTVFDKNELVAGDLVTDPLSPEFGKPLFYQMQNPAGQPVNIHHSRLIRFVGAPIYGANNLQGVAVQDRAWGDPVLISILEDIKNADSTAANIASLVFEAKVDVFRIPGFMEGMADPKYVERVATRFGLAAQMKGINGALVLDKEEEYETKNAQFAGLTDILHAFLQIVSGAADIPVTRLLGQSPSGLNSTGESDLRNYYDRIQAAQTLEMAPALIPLDEALIRSALGDLDASIHYAWAPLWQPTEVERSKIGKEKAETVKTLSETSLFPPEALSRAAVNMLVEDSVLPGLEKAIEEFPLEEFEEEEEERAAAEAANAAAAARAPKLAAPGAARKRRPVADAAPRTLYVSRKVTNGAEIVAWAREQGITGILDADDLHVTIAYSREAVDWMKVGNDWNPEKGGGMTIEPGGARLIERFGEALVLLFNSSSLAWRHVAIREAGASWDHPDYQPHVTISLDADKLDPEAFTPYRGKIELGPEIFEEIDEDWKAKARKTAGT